MGIGGRSPREEMLRLEERPSIRVSLRDSDKVGSDLAGAELELGFGDLAGKIPERDGAGLGHSP